MLSWFTSISIFFPFLIPCTRCILRVIRLSVPLFLINFLCVPLFLTNFHFNSFFPPLVLPSEFCLIMLFSILLTHSNQFFLIDNPLPLKLLNSHYSLSGKSFLFLFLSNSFGQTLHFSSFYRIDALLDFKHIWFAYPTCSKT